MSKQIGVALKNKYGEDYYVKLGRLGGTAQVDKGFAKMPKEKVSAAGKKGGAISRRGPAKITPPIHIKGPSILDIFRRRHG